MTRCWLMPSSGVATCRATVPSGISSACTFRPAPRSQLHTTQLRPCSHVVLLLPFSSLYWCPTADPRHPDCLEITRWVSPYRRFGRWVTDISPFLSLLSPAPAFPRGNVTFYFNFRNLYFPVRFGAGCRRNDVVTCYLRLNDCALLLSCSRPSSCCLWTRASMKWPPALLRFGQAAPLICSTTSCTPPRLCQCHLPMPLARVG